MTTDETVSAGVSLLSLAVNAVFALGLNRDPANKSASPLSFFECEERRRLFWSVFSLCGSVTTVSTAPPEAESFRSADEVRLEFRESRASGRSSTSVRWTASFLSTATTRESPRCTFFEPS